MATTNRQSRITKPDITTIILTASAIALTLLASATSLLLPAELRNVLIAGSGLTLYILVSTLPYASNKPFGAAVCLMTAALGAVTIAAGTSNVPPDKTISLAIQFAIPIILAVVICLGIFDLGAFTIRLVGIKMRGRSRRQTDHPAQADRKTISATTDTPLIPTKSSTNTTAA